MGQVEAVCQAQLIAIKPIGAFFVAIVVFVSVTTLHEQVGFVALEVRMKRRVALIDHQVAQDRFADKFLLDVVPIQTACGSSNVLCIGQNPEPHVDPVLVVGFHITIVQNEDMAAVEALAIGTAEFLFLDTPGAIP